MLLLVMACGPGPETVDPRRPGRPSAIEPEASFGSVSPGEALVFRGSEPKNVLILSIDTLRTDRLNHFGYEVAITSPTIDRLLNEGVALEDHHSCSSWTYPSMLCALSGRDQWSLGFLPEAGNAVRAFPGVFPSLARHLWSHGYATRFVTGNGLLTDTFGLNEGYEQTELASGSTKTVEAAKRMLDDLPEGRWLVHVHFMDPHFPYTPPDNYIERAGPDRGCPIDLETREAQELAMESWQSLASTTQQVCMEELRRRYDADIRYADDGLASPLDHLALRDDAHETLVVLVSDHGEEFLDHGRWGHGTSLHSEVVNGLAGFWMPGLAPSSHTGITSHEDIVPTILEALAIDPPGGLTGVPLGRGRGHALQINKIHQSTGVSVVTPENKLLYVWNGERYLFDRRVDPAELNDIYDPADPLVVALWDILTPAVDATQLHMEGLEPVAPGP